MKKNRLSIHDLRDARLRPSLVNIPSYEDARSALLAEPSLIPDIINAASEPEGLGV